MKRRKLPDAPVLTPPYLHIRVHRSPSLSERRVENVGGAAYVISELS